MPRFRMFAVAAAGALMALAGPLASSSVPAGATTPLTSPPTVAATNWTNNTAAPGSGSNSLNNVSCTTSTFCMAVGPENSGTGGGTFIQEWNGTKWTVVPSVNAPATTGDFLSSVSCVGTNFCIAVGGSGTGTAVAETWNGTSWTFVAAAAPAGSTTTTLSSVSCVTATTCEVLGTSTVGTTSSLFGNQWNGTTLTATTAATPTSTDTTPVPSASGMDCVTASWCIAVGVSDTQAPTGTSFGELWNGTAWTLQTMPLPSAGIGSQLSAVSCAGASFCQAVGQVNVSTGPTLTQNLIENWNGTQWALTSSVPDTSATASNLLKGVDCFSATTCSAVGSATATTGPTPASLALTWNGTAWSIVSNTPNQGTVQTSLAGVSCVTDWSCVAVGLYGSGVATNSAFAMAAPISRTGYRFVASDGGVFNYGSGAPFLGSMGGTPLNKPIVGMAVMPGGDGYYLVASDGGIFNYGPPFYGSTGSIKLNKPIVGMTAVSNGYYLSGSDGGVFTYPTTNGPTFYGSTGSIVLNQPIVGIAG